MKLGLLRYREKLEKDQILSGILSVQGLRTLRMRGWILKMKKQFQDLSFKVKMGEDNGGAYNRTNSLASRQPGKDLPWWPSTQNISCRCFFFVVGSPKESIFLTTLYGLYFSQQYTNFTNYISSWYWDQTIYCCHFFNVLRVVSNMQR